MGARLWRPDGSGLDINQAPDRLGDWLDQEVERLAALSPDVVGIGTSLSDWMYALPLASGDYCHRSSTRSFLEKVSARFRPCWLGSEPVSRSAESPEWRRASMGS
jgi:hypothetical protein